MKTQIAKARRPEAFLAKVGDEKIEMAWVWNDKSGCPPGIEIQTSVDGLTPKDARRLAKWLIKAAEHLESL